MVFTIAILVTVNKQLKFIKLVFKLQIEFKTEIPCHSLFMKTFVQYFLENNPQCHTLWANT